MSTCRKCQQGLELGVNWNKSAQSKHDYICTPCASEYKKRRDKLRPEETKVSGRLRMRKWREDHPEVRDEARDVDKQRERSRVYSREHREIKRAQMKAHYAVKTGRLQKQPCSVCGNPEAVKHHYDYSKPLDVVWLCSKHHARVHNWIE